MAVPLGGVRTRGFLSLFLLCVVPAAHAARRNAPSSFGNHMKRPSNVLHQRRRLDTIVVVPSDFFETTISTTTGTGSLSQEANLNDTNVTHNNSSAREESFIENTPPNYYNVDDDLMTMTLNTSMCSICGSKAQLMPDQRPAYEPSEEEGIPANLTCGDWESLAQTTIPVTATEPCSQLQWFYSECCQGSTPRYVCEANIRQSILENYDSAIPPVTGVPGQPLEISVNFQFQTVENIDVQAGTAKIFFIVDFEWKDPRLTWDLNDTHCAGYTTAWTGLDRETTEIWVPDFDLYNQVSGLSGLSSTQAIVVYDGTVNWVRIGGIEALCQFTGLSQIPFETLGCQLLLGPWVRNDPSQIRYNLFNGSGLSAGRFEATYNEYLPVPELFESGKTYDEYLIYFNLFFKRAESYYVFNLIVSPDMYH